MKAIEGFHIKKFQRGAKKGQEYINYNKRYVWKIPERLEGKIDKGDIVYAHSKDGDTDIKTRVLVANILENGEDQLRSVIKIDKKYEIEK